MELLIRLKDGYSLADVAGEIEMLNYAMAPLLENGPLAFNKNPTKEIGEFDQDGNPVLDENGNPKTILVENVEGYLGNGNTIPVLGYVRVRIDNYRKLILPDGITPTTFKFVFGEAVETIVDENGNVIDIFGGRFQ